MVNLTNQQFPISNPPDKIVMAQIFGDFIADIPTSEEYLIIGFSPSSMPLKQRWRNNGLSADFIADYFTTFFPGDPAPDKGISMKAEVKSAVSFIANELLENAMKFSDETSQYPVTIKLNLKSNNMVFWVTNSISYQQIEKLQAFIQDLTLGDPSDLFIRRLEEPSFGESGLGLLTMVNDYQAKLGWKFETVQTDPLTIAVTTMVQLKI
ncbi:ATP-binding protein [Microseira sp. BLCC-F43]|jgi:hypothetical protein|uniref:slr1658 superfamily regulator n=1 Tax=Microseira sp. BLCC-F43 TaxID=3153602 RepID=UPI0035B829E0